VSGWLMIQFYQILETSARPGFRALSCPFSWAPMPSPSVASPISHRHTSLGRGAKATLARGGLGQPDMVHSCSWGDVCSPPPWDEAQAIIEPMHTRISAATLHQNVVAVVSPSLGQRGSDDSAAVTKPAKVRMRDDVFLEIRDTCLAAGDLGQ